MNDEENWLAQLRQLHDTDKAYREAAQANRAKPEPAATAARHLQHCRAHELLRQVQKTLLDGGGRLQFYEDVGGYDRAVVLMWQGPISAAAKPATIDDVEASIIVGANDQGVFVNDRRLAEVSPEALRRRLLEVAQDFVADQSPAGGDSSERGVKNV